MTNRRDFFKTTSLLVAGSMIGANIVSAAIPAGKKKKKVGLPTLFPACRYGQRSGCNLKESS